MPIATKQGVATSVAVVVLFISCTCHNIALVVVATENAPIVVELEKYI